VKSSITVVCSKGHPIVVPTIGTQEIGTVACSECGCSGYVVDPLGNKVSRLILERAWTELKNEDFTLTILLGAVAVECELAYLFFKWKRVDLIPTGGATAAEEEEWSEYWRKLGIKPRLDEVSVLLTGHKFDVLLAKNPQLLQGVDLAAKGFTSPKDFFDKEFFRKRNRIVHSGEIDYGVADGEMCFQLAARMFGVMNYMDYLRVKAMDAKHAAARNVGPQIGP
jgi:hypothetical protein